jgi:hypothetical protein
MKAILNFFLLIALLSTCIPTQSDAQIIRKPKILKKAQDILLNQAEDQMKKEQGNNEQTSEQGNAPTGQKTKGKKLSPPDVRQHLSNSRPYVDAKNYSSARFEIQQALVGVELQLGQKVLDDMPKEVNGMNYNPEEDELASQGAGFIGLAIGREYSGKDRTLHAAIVNNSIMLNMYNSYLSSSNYATADGEYKAVNVQGQRGAIKFDGDNTYELGVPMGQNTLFMLNCTNFADENEVIAAANKFNLEQMKTTLGEQ